MTDSEAVAYLLSLLGGIRSENFGLERIQRLLARLDHPERSARVVHIAGTNGKGSTAAMIEAGLRAAGFSTGLYTSPHLSRFNERFRLNGCEISGDAFAAAVDEVRRATEALIAKHGRRWHPTFFETVTAVGFCAFRNAAVDWVVLEVGLGGRLDATNVVESEVAVITPVAFDHEAFLGKSPEGIALEKAGILRSGSRLVLAPQHPSAKKAILGRAAELGTAVTEVGADWRAENLTHKAGKYCLEAVGPGERIPISISLAGRHQVDNALTAVATLRTLGVAQEAIVPGIAAVEWPGRLESLGGSPEILLDAAHNPAGARTLAQFLAEHHAGRRKILLYGSSRDKAVDEVAGLLFPAVDEVILTAAHMARSVTPATLLSMLDHLHGHIEVHPSVPEALSAARSAAAPDDLIVIAGSIFLIGEARAWLHGQPALNVAG